MVSDDFLKEIDQYSLSDLELIIDTQKELYSEEEMELLRQRVQKIKKSGLNSIFPRRLFVQSVMGRIHLKIIIVLFVVIY